MPSAIPANQEIDALHERIAALEFECADLRKRAEVPPDPRGGPSRAERAADAALLRSEARYRAVLAALPDLIFRLDRQGIFLEYHSPSAGDLYFPEEQFVGKPVGEVMPPEFAQRVVELVQQTLASDEQQLYAYEMTIDGALRHFEARFAVSGPDEVVAVVRNVTKRTRAEAELKAKENLLGAIVDSLPLWLAVKDREGRMLMVNRRMAEECGVSERDFVGLATMELPHSTPQEKARIVELDRRVMATGEPIDDPAVSVTLPGGEVRTVRSIMTPLRDAQQNIAGVVTISEDVSGRIRAEQELREGAERYRRLVEESPQGVLVVQDGTIVFVNRSEAEIFGYSAPQEMIGRRRNDHIAPHELERLMGYLEAREAGEQAPSHYAFQGLKKDGTPIWVETVAQVTTWEGKPATQSLHIDITERKRAEQALRDSQERFTWIAEHSPVMLYRYDSRRGAIDRLEFSYISPHAVKLTGFTPEEIIGDPTLLTGRYHPEDQADWRERLEAVTREGKDWDQVLRYRRKDGEYIWIHTQTWRNYLPDGSVEGAGYWTDVTERKRAEAALAASEALLRGFLDNTPVRVYLKDREGKYLMINRHYEVSTGFRREQVLGKTARDLFPAETAAVYLAHDREVRRQRKALQFEETDPRADGVRTFLTQRFPLFDAQGEVEAICGISTDITARKKAEQALAASEARIRNFTDSAPAFLAHVDSEGRYRFANAQYSKFFGLPEAEIVGSTIEELLGAEAYGMVRPHVEKALAGEEVAYEHALPLGDMGVRDLDVRYVPDRDDAGNVIGFYVAVLDITARKQAERRLRENERLLQAVFDALPIWVTVKDRELRHVMVNRRYAEDTGCTTERYPRVNALEVPYGTPEERERVHGYDIKVLETGEPVDIEELPITLGDGQQRIVRNINVPLRDDAGEVIGLVGISEDVTERKAVQRALEASERRLRTIVEQVPGVIYRRFGSTRGENRFAFVSPHAEALTGYTPEEIYANPDLMTGRYHPEDIPLLHAFHKKIEREEPKRGSYSVELRYRHKEGHYIWIRSNFKRTYRPDGAFEAVGVWMDITEQKQAEIALRLSEERFHQLAENIPGTVFEFVQRADGRYAMPYMNRNGIDYMGLSPEQAEKMKDDAAVVFQHMHPDEVGSFRQALADSKRTLKPFDWEGRGRAATGEWRWLHGFAFPRDAGHGNTLWNGVILDTTRRKRAEEALRESEERFRGLAEGSLQGMLVHRDFEVLFCNGAAAEMFGYGSPERLLAAGSIAPHIAPHERERIERFASVRIRGEAVPNRYEADYVRADGQPLTLEVLSQVIEWEERPAIQSTLVDITERKRAEAALQQSEERYRRLVEESLQGFLVFRGSRILYANRAEADTFGFASPEDMVGTSVDDLLAPRERERLISWRAARARGEDVPARYEYEGRRRDGTPVWVDNMVKVISWEGQPAMQAIHIDVTARKLAEDELRLYSAKLERSNQELQEFAFVASHDLQEPLRKIQAFGEVLLEEYGGTLDSEGKTYLEFMRGAAVRMQTLIQDLLSLSRVTSPTNPFEPVDLNEVMGAIVTDMAPKVEEAQATIRIGDLPTVRADPTQMYQLLQNLVSNALKYHGTEPPVVTVTSQALPGTGDVELTVEDNGIGFEEQHAQRIFGIFQRLHGRGKYEGTGIGLAICQRIVERHGGTIAARGKPGQGAAFVLTLPMDSQERGTPDAADA